MASNKTKLLEQSLQEDLHPFAARQKERSAEESSPEPSKNVAVASNALPVVLDNQSIQRPYARTVPVRNITRYAYEVFQDQIDTLKQFSLEEKLRGEKGSMSQMVREALDAYISKRKRSEE